jgi:hypothetical protein
MPLAFAALTISTTEPTAAKVGVRLADYPGSMDVEDSLAKRLSYSLHGLQQATLRCDAAHWHRPEDAFTAAAEAVSWAVALDAALERSRDNYTTARQSNSDGQTVRGMKFVRDQVHHADELYDFVFLGAVFGGLHGMRAGWVWKQLGEIEPPLTSKSRKRGKSLGYDAHLGGKALVDPLLDANRWFSSLSPPLPPLPPDQTGTPRAPFELPEGWPPLPGDRRI